MRGLVHPKDGRRRLRLDSVPEQPAQVRHAEDGPDPGIGRGVIAPEPGDEAGGHEDHRDDLGSERESVGGLIDAQRSSVGRPMGGSPCPTSTGVGGARPGPSPPPQCPMALHDGSAESMPLTV